MHGRYGQLKFVCVAIAVLATLLLLSSQAGAPGPHDDFAAYGRTGGDAVREAEQSGSKTVAPESPAIPENETVNMIEDMEKWDHPAKDIFRAEGIAVRSLELLKDGTYPIFYVDLPFKLSGENEKRMDDAVEKIARANSWGDFELVDKAADVRIKVTCDRQFGMVDDVMINGDRNYFLRLAEKNAVENYSYIEPLKIKKEGKFLKRLLESGWRRERLQDELGKSGGSFDGYDIYFETGASVKCSGNRVYNIVLNNRYRDSVLKGIDFGDGRKQVVGLLGPPQFEDPDRELFGYKAEGFYIFFTGAEKLKEISIYSRNTGYGRDVLKTVLEKYGKEPDKIDLFSLVQELKSRWPEYDLYYNERGGLGISYDSIGISADNAYQDRGGPFITVYANFEGAVDSTLELPDKTEGLREYSNDLLFLKLDTDCIFAAEKGRLERAGYLSVRRREEGAVSPDGSMKVLDNGGATYERAGLYILSTDGSRPDAELHTGNFTDKVIWLDNRYFIYDVSVLGVFIYDTASRKTMEVLGPGPGEDAGYELESYKAGVITIKNLSDGSRLTRTCTFAADGTLVIK
jgi:hypothetical protein